MRSCTRQAWSGWGIPPDDTKAGSTRTMLRSHSCWKTSVVPTKLTLMTGYQQQRMTSEEHAHHHPAEAASDARLLALK